MTALILEDEKPAIETLEYELSQMDEGISVLSSCGSVAEGIAWLKNNKQPDLILMDIQLSDGLSFNIFNSLNISCPVIFITAYDKYLTEAFEYNSIDYLLKPIVPAKLKAAIRKYKKLQTHFVSNYSALTEHFQRSQDKKISRIVVKRGLEFQTVRLEDVAYFFTEHKLVFLVDKENRKYLADRSNLSDLEEELDPKLFHRVNRKYIINANYIRRFKPLDRSKINVELLMNVNEEIIVSQENASSFKKWISEH